MGDLGNFYYSKVKGYATVNGTRLPMCGFEATYELDEIPMARIELAVGRNQSAGGFNSVSEAQGFIGQLEPYAEVEVYMNITPEPSGRAAPPGFPAGYPVGKDFLVFKGFLSSTGSDRSFYGTATLSITAFSETVALAGTTQFSRGVQVAPVGTGTGAASAVFTGNQTAKTLEELLEQEYADITGDLWKQGIEPIFRALASDISEFATDGGANNDFGTRALRRINNGKGLGSIPPLVLPMPADLAAMYTKSMIAQLAVTVWGQLSNEGGPVGDLYSLLMGRGGIANAFYLHLVPGVEGDGIVPITPGLDTVYEVIEPSEYTSIGLARGADNPFSGFSEVNRVVYISSNVTNGQWSAENPPNTVVGSASVSFPENRPGRMTLINCPGWLKLPLPSGNKTVNPGKGIPDAANPYAGDADELSPKRREFVVSEIGNMAARSSLFELLFADHQLVVQGRFRVDIAPGSIIQVNSVGERFAGAVDSFFGMVKHVKLVFRDSQLLTQFLLTHVKTKAEFESGKLTTSEHPLWEAAWSGGKLVEF